MTTDREPEQPRRPHQPAQAPHSSRLLDGSRRYIALRYELTATYHDTWSEAEVALADLPASRRAGIVDSRTGKTLASQAAYPEVVAAVSGEVLGVMTRRGALGDLAGEQRRRAAAPSREPSGRR